MKAFIAFTKKEFTESVRTYRLPIMAAVFLLLGMMSPALAKYTPEILAAFPSEFTIEIPTPTALDSWTQFVSNVGQMGLLALAIVYGGITAGDISRGTIVNMLTKGLKRSAAILSKLTAAAAVWTVCYLLSYSVCFAYTAYFWSDGNMSNVFLTFFSLWLYGVLLIVFAILGGALFSKTYGSLLFLGGAVVALSLLNIIPPVRRYNPVSLAGGNLSLLSGAKTAADFIPAVTVCAALIVVLTAVSIVVFNRKRL